MSTPQPRFQLPRDIKISHLSDHQTRITSHQLSTTTAQKIERVKQHIDKLNSQEDDDVVGVDDDDVANLATHFASLTLDDDKNDNDDKQDDGIAYLEDEQLLRLIYRYDARHIEHAVLNKSCGDLIAQYKTSNILQSPVYQTLLPDEDKVEGKEECKEQQQPQPQPEPQPQHGFLQPYQQRKLANLITTIEAIREAKNIVLLTGAGLSTAAGVPDFRSENGLYRLLQNSKLTNDEMDAAFGDFTPEDLFDLNYFRQNPVPFYTFYYKMGLCDEMIQPTKSHQFIQQLSAHNKLLRVYTQNIDGLDIKSGIPASKLVRCHGHDEEFVCTCCEMRFPREMLERGFLKQHKIPYCSDVMTYFLLGGEHHDHDANDNIDIDVGEESSNKNSDVVGGDGDEEKYRQQFLSYQHKVRKHLQAQANARGKSTPTKRGSHNNSNNKNKNNSNNNNHTNNNNNNIQKNHDTTIDEKTLLRNMIKTAERCNGVQKPTITFFGENLPQEFFQKFKQDRGQADLIIVMATSLQVSPVKDVPCALSASGGSLLSINMSTALKNAEKEAKQQKAQQTAQNPHQVLLTQQERAIVKQRVLRNTPRKSYLEHLSRDKHDNVPVIVINRESLYQHPKDWQSLKFNHNKNGEYDKVHHIDVLSDGEYDEWEKDMDIQEDNKDRVLTSPVEQHDNKHNKSSSSLPKPKPHVPVIHTELMHCDYEFLGDADAITQFIAKCLGW